MSLERIHPHDRCNSHELWRFSFSMSLVGVWRHGLFFLPYVFVLELVLSVSCSIGAARSHALDLVISQPARPHTNVCVFLLALRRLPDTAGRCFLLHPFFFSTGKCPIFVPENAAVPCRSLWRQGTVGLVVLSYYCSFNSYSWASSPSGSSPVSSVRMSVESFLSL